MEAGAALSGAELVHNLIVGTCLLSVVVAQDVNHALDFVADCRQLRFIRLSLLAFKVLTE